MHQWINPGKGKELRAKNKLKCKRLKWKCSFSLQNNVLGFEMLQQASNIRDYNYKKKWEELKRTISWY